MKNKEPRPSNPTEFLTEMAKAFNHYKFIFDDDYQVIHMKIGKEE